MSGNRMEFLQDNLRVFVVPVDILEAEGLTTHEKLVYISLRSFANPHKAEAFPSYETIARLGSMTRRHAINCVNRLVELGYIKKEIRLDVSRNRKIRNTSNLYTLHNPKVVNTIHHAQSSEYDSPPLVNTVHPPSEYSSPKQNQLKESFRSMIDCMGASAIPADAAESVQSDEIYEALEKYVPSNCYVANAPLGEAYINEMYLMLVNQFKGRLDPAVVKIACELYFDRACEVRPPHGVIMKIPVENPVGFFHRCYEDAIKQYKATRNRTSRKRM